MKIPPEDEYVEMRFEYNEFLQRASKSTLIRIINTLTDRADQQNYPLTISDRELNEIIGENNEQDM